MKLFMQHIFFLKADFKSNMLRVGILSERSLNTDRAFQTSGKQSPKTSSQELCIQTWCAPVPCSSIFSALLKWFVQAARLTEEDEVVFGISQ